MVTRKRARDSREITHVSRGNSRVHANLCTREHTVREDHTERLLDGQCEVAKQEMKKAPPDEIGSWQRAVTVADGAWMTRGHHSQNFTFHVRDYMRNSVLYYIHFCQRGKKPLYAGTSKSMEGAAAEIK